MDSGVLVLLGALIGATSTLCGIVLNGYIERTRKAETEAIPKTLLTKMLNGHRDWRRLSTLTNVTGLSEADGKRLLLQLGARGSETNGALWGLISRNPLSDNDPDLD